MNVAQKNSVGLSIMLQCFDDDRQLIILKNVQDLKIFFFRPDGTAGEWPGQVVNENDGTFEYFTTSENDLDMDGEWIVQGRVEFSDGRKFRTTPGRMHVKKNVA